MSLKKIAAPLLAGLLTVFLLAAPASAHGGHHGRGYGCAAPQAQTTCPAGCAQTGWHSHQGVGYCGYHHANNTCSGYCAALCEVEGCVEAGRHTHDNVLYCGYAHENGYCDNTCAAILAAQMLALSDPELADRLARMRADMTAAVLESDKRVAEQFAR